MLSLLTCSSTFFHKALTGGSREPGARENNSRSGSGGGDNSTIDMARRLARARERANNEREPTKKREREPTMREPTMRTTRESRQ